MNISEAKALQITYNGDLFIESKACLGPSTIWVWFYGISTIVGYLMPNSFYTYISNI